MAVFIGTLVAMSLDPIVLIACWAGAAMIGVYRIAIPVCAAIAFALFAGLSDYPLTWLTALMFLATGAFHGALGLWLWRLIPDKVKGVFVSSNQS